MTRTLPEIVASALSGTSGRIWSSTSPFPELVPELADALEPEEGAEAELFDASTEGFASARSTAGEGEAAGAWEISFAEGFTEAPDFAESRDESRDESRLGDEAFDLADEPANESAGSSPDCGATRAAALVDGAAEDSTRRPRILGNAMMDATTTSPTAMGMT
jgi:hypothetical protein